MREAKSGEMMKMIEEYDVWYDEKLICFMDGVLSRDCDNCPFIKECKNERNVKQDLNKKEV